MENKVCSGVVWNVVFFTTLLQSNVGGVGTLGTGEMAYSRGFLSYSYHRLLSH